MSSASQRTSIRKNEAALALMTKFETIEVLTSPDIEPIRIMKRFAYILPLLLLAFAKQATLTSCRCKAATKSCLRKVMGKIGANASEEAFAAQRIQLRLKTKALLGETDKFISNAEAMLDRFKKDDEEWERRGRNLGFNFWD